MDISSSSTRAHAGAAGVQDHAAAYGDSGDARRSGSVSSASSASSAVPAVAAAAAACAIVGNIVLLPFVAGSLRARAIPFVATSSQRTNSIFAALNRTYPSTAHLQTSFTSLPSAASSTSKSAFTLSFIDLGSGDGRIVLHALRWSNSFHAATATGPGPPSILPAVPRFAFAECHGVEVNSLLLAISRTSAFLQQRPWSPSAPRNTRVSFSRTDLWKVDLSRYDVVMVFGDLRLMV
ncbi:hypothetical protein HDU83_002484 [Entophlyctis luteolus]|nr:hypothetical protein HDU83_002484 [Entophlyctis luteolus]